MKGELERAFGSFRDIPKIIAQTDEVIVFLTLISVEVECAEGELFNEFSIMNERMD